MEYVVHFQSFFVSFLALLLPALFFSFKRKNHHHHTTNPSMAAPPDWSQLPAELLHLISQRLNSPLYLLRFRSVCSTWRHSSASSFIPIHHFPFNFPPLSDHDHHDASSFSLTKRTVVLITPPPPPHHQTQTPWLVKIGEDLCDGDRTRTRLWHPLFRGPHFPIYAMRVLDFYNLSVLHIGNEFNLHHSPPSPSGHDSLYMEKVVAATTYQGKQEVFVLLTIHISGKLALFRSGDESWRIIPDMPTPYDDVCVFNGRHFAVDGTGRTVVVGLDSALDLVVVAEPVFGGDKKFLVESEGELLLVDKHMSSNWFCGGGEAADDEENDGDDDNGEGVYRVGWERAVSFDVYRLDQKEKRWVEVTSLGDRVLFLGGECAFSASASDLRVCKGNCVVFKDLALECAIGVFPLDVGRISPLSNHPDYSRLFWPCPDWIWSHCH
ncbi:F-box protein SKIP23-like [Lotus japonicus]|uniref:F-box protein SKIP23-like n=1 Tax=Lotus japonicus TaxID=34305 RepID=UPI00258CFDC3|nr:F-box protein SKIP23-like [Lotus japonicus]